MITEDYCSYEVAKLLCEKGFEIDTSKDYWKIGEDGTMYFMSSIGAYTSNPNIVYAIYRPENSYPCPTHQMAMKWLREREKLAYNILIIADGDLGDLHYSYEIQEIDNEFLQVNGSFDIEDQRFDTYEEACEAGIKYCLENLI